MLYYGGIIILKRIRTCPVCGKKYQSKQIVEDIIKDFPEKKEKWLELECPDAPKHYQILLEKKIENLSQKTKQKILDLIWDGKNIGEIKEILNLDTMIIATVIQKNIKNISYLRRDAI